MTSPRFRKGLLLAFSYTVCLVLFVVVVYPVLWMLLSSLKETWEILTLPFSPPAKLSPANYVEAWRVAKFGRAFLNSIFVTTVSLVGILLISTMGGYVFAKLDFPGKTVLFYFWLLGMMVPSNVSLIPNFVIFDRLHLIDSYLSLFCIYFSSTSFGVFVMRSFFFTVPTEILEAARIDGCSEFSTFWRVALPNVRHALVTTMLLDLVVHWNDFLWPLVVCQEESTRTIQIGLAGFFTQPPISWGAILAYAVIATLPVLAVFSVGQRWIVQSLAGTGTRE